MTTLLLKIKRTPHIEAYLLAAAKDGALPQEMRDEARDEAQLEEVRFELLDRIAALGETTASGTAELARTLRSGGCELVLPTPAHRQRSPELEARLKQLREDQALASYRHMVRDVTKTQRREQEYEPFSSYLLQVSFGAHVLTVMGGLAAAGFVAGSTRGPASGAVGAALGLFAGLLVETVLFVVRNLKAEQVTAENARANDRSDQREPCAAMADGEPHLGSSFSLAHGKLKSL